MCSQCESSSRSSRLGTSPGPTAPCWTVSSFIKNPSPAVVEQPEQPLRGPQRELSARGCRAASRLRSPPAPSAAQSRVELGTIKSPRVGCEGMLMYRHGSGCGCCWRSWYPDRSTKGEQGARCLRVKEGGERQVYAPCTFHSPVLGARAVHGVRFGAELPGFPIVWTPQLWAHSASWLWALGSLDVLWITAPCEPGAGNRELAASTLKPVWSC